MKNADLIRESLDRIAHEIDPMKAIAAHGDVMFGIGMNACEERIVLGNKIVALRKSLFGNGDPADSLVAKVEAVEECVESHLKTSAVSIKEINLFIKGDTKIPGALERLRNIEEVVGEYKKLKWLVGGAIALQIVNTILGFV